MTKKKKKKSKPPRQVAAATSGTGMGMSDDRAVSKGPFQDLVSRTPPLTPQQLREERVALIRQIEQRRGRPLVIYATNANVSQPGVAAFIHRDDIVPLSEMLAAVAGDAVDVLLETPGGLAEVTIEIVNLLRPRFRDVAFIVPHMAMSAGTILAMSGDEILMDHRSSLGAIDPQFVGADGRPHAAQALLAGIEGIKKEVAKNGGNLSAVYVPILRNVDPGRLQAAVNASQLSRDLVTEWLMKYKFQKWTTHSSTGAPVTDADRRQRAADIATALCDHQSWLSHSRPIKIPDLEKIRLKITDYGQDPELQDMIWRLWVNLHHVMQSTNIYKLYESASGELWKIAVQQPQVPPALPPTPTKGIIDLRCSKCGTNHRIHVSLGTRQPADPGTIPFPANCLLKCTACGNNMDLKGLKLQLEAQFGKPVVPG